MSPSHAIVGALLLLAGCAAQTASKLPSAPPPRASEQAPPVANERELAEGVVYSRIVRDGERPLVAHVVSIDLARGSYEFKVTQGDRSKGMEHTARLTTAYADQLDAIVAVNASYFLPFAGGSRGGDDFYPKVGDPVNVSGAALSDGEQVSPVETDIDIRVNAIVCFSGARIAIADGQSCPDGFASGVAAGPLLLADGARRSFAAFDNSYAVQTHPRTAIGVSADGARGWIVVVDGRQDGYSVGASLDQLTTIFRDLGADDAINLDGGGSTTLAHVDDTGAPVLLNRPIHTGVPGRERPVANHILLLPAKR